MKYKVTIKNLKTGDINIRYHYTIKSTLDWITELMHTAMEEYQVTIKSIKTDETL